MSRAVFVEVRAVLVAIALMAALSFSGCVPAAVVGSDTTVVPDAVMVGSAQPTVDAAPSVVADTLVNGVRPATAAVPEAVTVGSAHPTVEAVSVDVSAGVSTSRNEPHPRAGQYKRTLIQQSHFVWGLDTPVASFAAQIHQESRWNPTARSPVGAAGLTQFMPATAQWIRGMDGQLMSGDVYNPIWAMRALVVYDQWLYKKVSGANPCERMAFAMSAYNGGLGWVNKRKARSPNPLQCFGQTCEINPGVSAASQRENAGYPKVILKTFEPLYVKAGWGRGVCHER